MDHEKEKVLFEMNEQKEKYKVLVIAILLAGACYLTYYFHLVFATGVVFTHFFYIPIILASLWWKRKGLVVAVFLAALVIFSHFFIRAEVMTVNDLIRATMFVIVAVIAAILSEQIAKAQEEIKKEKGFSANVIATVPDSLIAVDKDLRIKKANLSFQKIFGIDPEKAVGTRITDILGDEDEKLSTVLSKLLGTKTTMENLELHYYSEKLGERIFHIAARGIIQAEEGGQEDEVLVVIEDITERKRGEVVLRRFSEELELMVEERTKELAKERDYTRHLIESSPDFQMTLDRDGMIMDVNEAFEHVVGKSREELIGSSIYEYLPKEETEKAIAEIFEKGKVRNIELTARTPGKGTLISNFSGTVFTTPEEELGIYATGRDITEQRRAEEALKREKNFSANVIATVPDSLLVVDKDWRIKSANRSFYEKFQTEPDGVIGSGIAEVLGDKDGKLSTALTKLFGTGDMLKNFERHYQSEKLGERIFNITARRMLVAEEEEEEEEEVIVIEDITERKRAEKEVKKSHKFLETLIKNIPDALYIKDQQYRFSLVNQSYCDRAKITKDEILGETRYRETDEEIFKNGKLVEIPEQLFVDKEGKQHYTHLKKVPLIDESGKITHVLTISRDITEHKRLDDERELVLKELKELDKLKTNFLNVAYHEMRSPLGPILASASLLEQGYLTAKQKRLVFIIEQSVKQLEKSINRLLELTRVDAGQVELKLKTVSIPEIIKNVLAYLKPLADAKKQSITLDVPEGIEIEGDEQKITTIFDNLVSNAIKYTEKNGRIDIKVADRGGEDIVVSIADTGTGISEEQLSRVFERFYMADTSLSRKGGLGLGLSIVQEYVKLHGGKVWATSELGKGSNFFFSLPKKQKPPAKET
ncbi:MAG: PAS domain-containing sensor histidine kinase [Halobacteriota archaeon]